MESRHVLVCGGAGYIGSHMCRQLALNGYTPVTFDNFSSGNRWAVKWGPLVEGDLLDQAALTQALRDFPCEAVMHFAARALVGESMLDPAAYFRCNVVGTMNVLDAMRAAGVARIVFSSTAAVYGNPQYCPMDEAHPTRPINPYGWSKLMAERVIGEYSRAYGLSAICLRYFNVAGAADDTAGIGECHDPETHLVPNLIRAALDPDQCVVQVFGDTFPTVDGTCVRDYIHVEDLCDAHLRALRRTEAEPGLLVVNLGTGHGHSVGQVLAACRAVHEGRPEAQVIAPRDGDPAMLVAGNALAASALGWSPVRGLEEILASATQWHRSQLGTSTS
jgi:UDP-glucose 4-epimerase